MHFSISDSTVAEPPHCGASLWRKLCGWRHVASTDPSHYFKETGWGWSLHDGCGSSSCECRGTSCTSYLSFMSHCPEPTTNKNGTGGKIISLFSRWMPGVIFRSYLLRLLIAALCKLGDFQILTLDGEEFGNTVNTLKMYSFPSMARAQLSSKRTRSKLGDVATICNLPVSSARKSLLWNRLQMFNLIFPSCFAVLSLNQRCGELRFDSRLLW